MKVLLLKPSNLSDHIQPSLGLGFLAAQIRDDHQVKIVDCIKEHLPGLQLLPILREFNPDVVGSQCYSMDLAMLKPVLETVKRYNRDIVTIVGGAHPSAAPDHTLKYFGEDLLDFVFTGEGEIGFPLFLKELENPGGPNFKQVPGLGWKDNGIVHRNPGAQVEDLDRLGMPAWDLIIPESYPFSPHGVVCKNFPIAPVMATRGCPYMCTFCSSANTKLRKRSVELVIQEVKLLQQRHGIREFHMVDDNFTLDMEYAKEFAKALLSHNIKASWATPNGVRLERLDRPLLELLKQAGFYSLSVGIESGSDRIRIKMKKGSNLQKVRKDLEMVRDVGGIDVTGFFILGFPSETREDIEKTIRFSKDLPIQRATFHSFIPLPGTEVWREMEASKELDRVDWERYFFWAGAYIPQGLNRDELRRLHRKAFLSFYCRPRIILQNLKFLSRPRVIWYGLRYLWKRVRPEFKFSSLWSRKQEPSREPASSSEARSRRLEPQAASELSAIPPKLPPIL
jgi:anaerobic magnesium-protoporphyrin IX monomethyl ester cyclase